MQFPWKQDFLVLRGEMENIKKFLCIFSENFSGS